MNKIAIIFTLLLYALTSLPPFGGFKGACQDIHFSQFHASPMNLNPALSGDFQGAYRFVGNQRRQWVQVSPEAVPYHSFGVSADAANFMKINGFGAGLSIYNDKAGYSQFGTLQINLAGAYRKAVNEDSTMFFITGLQPGFTHRSINYDDLSFDRQYNGSRYDASSPTGENFDAENMTYLNLNAGIAWQYLLGERKQVAAGLSLYHINRPKQSFFNDNSVKLDRRLNFHLQTQFKLSEDFDLLPSGLFMSQGRFKELTVGTSVKYILDGNPWHNRAVYAGIWARTRDAAFLSLGLGYDSWTFGVSYDINYSNLTPASRYRGGLEFSVIYIIQGILPKRGMYQACPVYI